MADNCTNPKAANYNPNATFDDGSCLYTNSVGGVCYLFQDLPPDQIIDKSLTLSWSMEAKNWVFFHDYTPDFYFSTREQLYALKNNQIYKFNSGLPGQYFDANPRSFFIDAVFPQQDEVTLNTVAWIAKVMNPDGSESPYETLTHITVWNSKQCTGRIALSTIFSDLQYSTDRGLMGKWSFNLIRDAIAQTGVQFLKDIFNNFAVDPAALSSSIPWFDQQLLEDKYFMVRFEFDNTSGKKIYLEDTEVGVQKSYR